jgi:hypothetical protein
MCIAILQKPGAEKLNHDVFMSYGRSQQDGFGLMYVNDDVVDIINTMDLNEHWNNYDRIYGEFGKKSYIGIHFRSGTQGTRDVTNCHPFRVSETMGMMHNGVFSNIRKDNNKSDTHIFNEEFCIPLGDDIFENVATIDLLQKEIGSNKVIFLSAIFEPAYTIFGETMGEWRNNSWYSFKEVMHDDKNNWYHKKNTCCICKKRHIEVDMFCIDPPIGMKQYICCSCITESTKISDVISVTESKVWENNYGY